MSEGDNMGNTGNEEKKEEEKTEMEEEKGYFVQSLKRDFPKMQTSSLVSTFDTPITALLSPSEVVVFNLIAEKYKSIDDLREDVPTLMSSPNLFAKITNEKEVDKSIVRKLIHNMNLINIFVADSFDASLLKNDDAMSNTVFDYIRQISSSARKKLDSMEERIRQVSDSNLPKMIKDEFIFENIFDENLTNLKDIATLLSYSVYAYLYVKIVSIFSKLNPNVASKKFTAWNMSLPRKSTRAKTGKTWITPQADRNASVAKKNSEIDHDISFKRRVGKAFTYSAVTDNSWNYHNYVLSHFDVMSLVKIIPEVYISCWNTDRATASAHDIYSCAKNISNVMETNWRSIIFKINLISSTGVVPDTSGYQARGVTMANMKAPIYPVNISFNKKDRQYHDVIMDTKDISSSVRRETQICAITGTSYPILYLEQAGSSNMYWYTSTVGEAQGYERNKEPRIELP